MPDPLRFAWWDRAAQLESDQPLAHGIELAGRFSYITRTQLTIVGKPRDSVPQAVECTIGSSAELAGEFG
jgi:hypothetical protein